MIINNADSKRKVNSRNSVYYNKNGNAIFYFLEGLLRQFLLYCNMKTFQYLESITKFITNIYTYFLFASVRKLCIL